MPSVLVGGPLARSLGRRPLYPGPVDHDELVRLYGPWATKTPADVIELFAGYSCRWWIAGGWAIQAFTGVMRLHADIDPSIPRSEVAALRKYLDGVLDVWAADKGTLRPLTKTTPAVPASCSNLWLRPNGFQPWEYDVILMDTTVDTWTYKRDPRVFLPASEILWKREGVEYLRPEIQLLHKAPGLRVKDQGDFNACLPLLARPAKQWLRDSLATAHPGHPWISRLT